jgi:hypothetical protein
MTITADAAAPRDFLRLSRAAQWGCESEKTALTATAARARRLLTRPDPGIPCWVASPQSPTPFHRARMSLSRGLLRFKLTDRLNPIDLPGQTSKNPSGVSPIPTPVFFPQRKEK